MKKIFILFCAVTAYSVAFAQGKFAASVTNTGNVLSFHLKPDVTTSTGFSTVEFFLRYPDNTPAFNYGAVTVNTTDFPGMAGNGNVGGGAPGSGAWEIERNNPLYSLPGYKVDHFIYTAPAIISTTASYTGGTDYTIITIPLDGPGTATTNFQFVSDDFETTYYLAITDQNGQDLRPATPADFFYPSTATVAGPNGATIYFQALNNVPLPVKFLSFDAVKKDKSAVLTWAVENETSLTDRYVIERSVNGVDFKSAFTVAPKNNGLSGNTYSLTDIDITSLKSNGSIFYRVKQYDKDGKFAITPIKSVRVTGKGLAISVYPNPIKTFANVSIELDQDADAKMTITDAAGKQVQTIPSQLFKGFNTRKIDMTTLSSGSYVLTIQTATEVKTINLVKAK